MVRIFCDFCGQVYVGEGSNKKDDVCLGCIRKIVTEAANAMAVLDRLVAAEKAKIREGIEKCGKDS